MDHDKVGQISLIALIIYVVFIALNDVSIATSIASPDNLLLGLIWYIFSHPEYIILFIAFLSFTRSVNKYKDVIAGILFVTIFDIVSYPRLLSSGLPTDVGARANSDFIAATFFMNTLHLDYHLFWWVYYVILPIGLAVVVAWLVGWADFGKKVTKPGAL